MRPYAVFLLVCLSLTLLPSLQAQDVPPTPNEVQRVEAIATQVSIEIEQGVGAAQNETSRAFNLLGLFEAIGFFVTVGAGLGGLFGVFQLFSARQDLQQVRKDLLDEAQQLRASFAEEINRREQELRLLENNLMERAKVQAIDTSHALLANAMLPLGERQYRAGDYVGALNTYMRALELDRHNPVVHQRIGYVYTQKGDLEQAKQHYESAIEREKNFAPALAGLGFVNRRLGETIDKFLVNNDHLSATERIEKQVERDQLFNKAEGLLLQALALSPRLVDDDGESWWGVLGGLYKRRGQLDQALEAYKQVTEVTPESSYGYGNLAMLYMKKGEYDLMLKTYERVERIAATEALAETGNFWGYSDLTTARFAIGKVFEANESLPMAITLAPMDSPYMLKGLQDTLCDLMAVVPPDRRPPIESAIQEITLTLNERESMRHGV
jgi:tetratricopeptide (TPR) repeat protein